MRSNTNMTSGITGAFDRAYVINMAGATERWSKVCAEFARVGVEPVRLDAVRGKDLSAAERAALTTPTCSTFCTPATIGCAASHVALWKRMLQDGVDTALACEDDTQFVDGFRELLTEYATEFPPDFDVVYLGCFACTGEENVMTRVAMSLIGAKHASRDVSEHVWVPPTALTTHCYIVSAKGARKLLDAIDGHIATHIDKMMNGMMGRGELVAYAVRPLLTHQEISLAATSISTAKTPRGPSILLDSVPFDKDVTWGYALGAPWGRVGAYTLNMWTPIFLGGGLLAGVTSCSMGVALAFAILLLLADVLPMVTGDRDTAVACFVNVGLALVGWLVGMGVRMGVGARHASRCVMLPTA